MALRSIVPQTWLSIAIEPERVTCTSAAVLSDATVLSKICSNLPGNVFTATGRRASVSRQSRSIRRRLGAAGEEGETGDEREAIREDRQRQLARMATVKRRVYTADLRERQPIKSAAARLHSLRFARRRIFPRIFFPAALSQSVLLISPRFVRLSL